MSQIPKPEYPRPDRQRSRWLNLNGAWDFALFPQGEEAREAEFHAGKRIYDRVITVPFSWGCPLSGVKTDEPGVGWYRRTAVYAPSGRLWLCFGGADYETEVFVNGTPVMTHRGGYTPFEADVTDLWQEGENTVEVRCADYRRKDQTYGKQGYGDIQGIWQTVWLEERPAEYITDFRFVTRCTGDVTLTVHTNAQDGVMVMCDFPGAAATAPVQNGKAVLDFTIVEPFELWSPENPFLYEGVIQLGDDTVSTYFGLREIGSVNYEGRDHAWITLNGKPVYLKGFGKHEDSDIKGKGLDEAINVRDFELLKWIGANSIRTSHYPYSEELMQMADRQGYLVIDEVPAVGMNFWKKDSVFEEGLADRETLAHHKDVLTELYQRDKNHPCVIAWNVSNEAQTQDANALAYFEEVVAHIRSLDDTRPICNVTDNTADVDTVGHLFDMIGLNRYYSWYYDLANLKSIYPRLTREFRAWHEKIRKPIFMSEYGADTIAGNHKLPETIFSEEYQIEFYKENHRALDDCEFVIGEHPWAFADFMTSAGLKRFDGNKKGIFTRQRQPKSVAFLLRDRWHNK